MSDPRDDDRPRSARPAVPPFRGPRTESTPERPAERGQGAAPSSAAPRPFIPGAPGSAAERPLTPPAEPELEPEPVLDSPPPTPDLSFIAPAQSAVDETPAIAPFVEKTAEAEPWTPAASTMDGSARDHSASDPGFIVAEGGNGDARGVAHASPENGASQDQRLPALRFTGSSAFAAIAGASDGADVDASVDDAFSALDTSAPPAPAEVRATERMAEPASVSHLEAVEAPQPSTELPWLDTGSEPELAPRQAEADAVAVADDSTERVAHALEMLAARVRRGELTLPGTVAGAGEEAMLAAVLAALLGVGG
jgi:hypothetical protein